MNIKAIFYFLILGFFIIYVSLVLSRNWVTVINFKWQLNFIDIVFAILCLIPIYFVNVFTWHLILLFLGQKISYKKNLRIWTVSNLARFIPGSIWQYPSRLLLLRQYGITKSQSTIAIILEFLFNILSGGLLILFFLNFIKIPEDLKQYIQTFSLIMIVIFLIVSLIINNFRNKIVWFLNINKLYISNLRFGYLPLIAFGFFLSFILGGGALFFISRNAINLDLQLVVPFIGIYIISWLVGYFVIIAPGGLGVQDITMSLLLTNYIPNPIALVVVVGFRLVLYLSEFLALFLGMIIEENRK